MLFQWSFYKSEWNLRNPGISWKSYNIRKKVIFAWALSKLKPFCYWHNSVLVYPQKCSEKLMKIKILALNDFLRYFKLFCCSNSSFLFIHRILSKKVRKLNILCLEQLKLIVQKFVAILLFRIFYSNIVTKIFRKIHENKSMVFESFFKKFCPILWLTVPILIY